MISLFEELRLITKALEGADIPYAIVGGLAYNLWVEARATEDIDLLIRPEDWNSIPPLLHSHGYLDLSTPMDFLDIRIRRLVKIQGEAVMIADFLLADQEEFRRGIETAAILKYNEDQYRVARPEAVIALKRGRMSGKDRIDIEGLSKLIGGEAEK